MLRIVKETFTPIPEAFKIVNGRDKLSQKWSFKSEPVWKREGIS
jgi:hypothetical protein